MTKPANQPNQTEKKATGKEVAVRVGLVLIAGVALAAVARGTKSDAALERTAPVQTTSTSPLTAVPSNTNTPVSLPHVPNPQPWQYDPQTNMHYHAGHGHWHAGPPPAGVTP